MRKIITTVTAGSEALTRRVIIDCSAPTIAAAAGTGSSALCGCGMSTHW